MSQVPTAAAVPVPGPPPAAASPVVVAAAAAAAAAAAVVAPEDGAARPVQLYGYTAEQLAAWRPKFNEKLKVHLDKSRSLIEPSKAATIKALLKDWDSLDRVAKNTLAGGNANYWHRTYIVNAADDSLITLGTTNKRVVTTDKIFDELLPVHAENQCIKGKLLFKKIKDKLAAVTQDVCVDFCKDCPICLVQVRIFNRNQPAACSFCSACHLLRLYSTVCQY